MIIGDFHVECVRVVPTKADAPLGVDADRMLTLTVIGKRMETITRGKAEFVEVMDAVEDSEFVQRPSLDFRGELAATFSSKDRCCFRIRKVLYHE